MNQSEDIPGMDFLNSAFDSSTFIRTNYNYMKSFAAANANVPSLSRSHKSHHRPSRNVNNNNNKGSIIKSDSKTKSNQGNNNNNEPNNSEAANNETNANQSNPNQQGFVAQNSVSRPQLSSKSSSIVTNFQPSISSRTTDGRTIWLRHLAAAAASASAKREYCSKTQIYCEAVSRALDIGTCRVVPFFGAFLHDLRFIIESVPSVNVTCNRNVQKPIEMVSKLNGEENYFTRICVAGLLNTRKLELAHMLLQDISMFHSHPMKMPDSNMDSNRFISAAVSQLVANDRKAQAHLSLNDSASKYGNTTTSTAGLLNPLVHSNLSKSASSLTYKSSSSLNKASEEAALRLESYNEEVGGLNDLASLISYVSGKTSQSFTPIRDDFSMVGSSMATPPMDSIKATQHNISFVQLQDNPGLDNQVIQTLQNGFTFVCALNELEVVQSSCLLNIRLEANNSTLVWSKPAWDISNAWISPAIGSSPNSKLNEFICIFGPLINSF